MDEGVKDLMRTMRVYKKDCQNFVAERYQVPLDKITNPQEARKFLDNLEATIQYIVESTHDLDFTQDGEGSEGVLGELHFSMYAVVVAELLNACNVFEDLFINEGARKAQWDETARRNISRLLGLKDTHRDWQDIYARVKQLKEMEELYLCLEEKILEHKARKTEEEGPDGQ